jgi:DNA-binding transcriptional MerR regulator
MTETTYLTIGQLAKRVGLRSSALRYYEEQGLLRPDGRTEGGYRFYAESAEKTLQLIKRAQRLGLSLEDIKQLLQGYQADNLSDEAIISIVEARALVLERQLTELLVQQHELDLFLQDMRHKPMPETHTGSDHFDQLLQRICLNPHEQTAQNWLDWLVELAGCRLNSQSGQAILKKLEGQHSHIWQEDNGYHILIVSNQPEIGQALTDLANLEKDCNAPMHSDLAMNLIQSAEGYELYVEGENAFIYARLFLALEQISPSA